MDSAVFAGTLSTDSPVFVGIISSDSAAFVGTLSTDSALFVGTLSTNSYIYLPALWLIERFTQFTILQMKLKETIPQFHNTLIKTMS